MSAQSENDQNQISNSENPNFYQDHLTSPVPEFLQPLKTLTLETPDPPPPQSPQLSLDDDDEGESVPPSSFLRRGGVGGGGGGGGKRKKQKRRPAAERKLQEKLKYLSENMNAVAFVPAKRLDFACREAFLRRIGLWDFVNLEFDSSVRVDLVAQLIASYSSDKRSGYVNGLRIGVNRADLARALKLPTRREKGSVQVGGPEVSESEDSVGFLEEFVSNWILLHGDAFIMPDEILNWIKMIKEGNFEKVDWAGMIWFMVEKELGAQQLTDCYYASHLQQLIKFQKEILFEEGPELEDNSKDDVDVKEEEEEEDNGGADVKMGEAEDSQVQREVEGKNIELSLGQEKSVEKDDDVMEGSEKDDVMDFDMGKGEDSRHWLMDGKSDSGRHFMQPCGEFEASNAQPKQNTFGVIDDVDDEYNVADEEHVTRGVDDDDDEEEGGDGDDDEEEQDGEFQIMQKCDSLEGLSSSNLIQAMEAQNAFGSGVQFRDNLSNDLMLPRIDTDAVGSSIFGDNGKRHAGHVSDMSHHSLNGSNKRPRIDEPVDFHTCMEQIQNWVGKARMMYETKEQAFTHANMQQEAFISEIQHRDAMITQLHKARIEEQHKYQAQVHQYEHELSMMVGLLDGYRKALKETQRAFAEYRARCPLPEDEPLYKDVSGSGGLVLSTMELEKQRLKKEEEQRVMRLYVEKSISHFETYWLEKFQGYSVILDQIDTRIGGIDHDMNLLKESFMKRKVEASDYKAMGVSEFIGMDHSKEVAEHSTLAEDTVGCSTPAESVECNAPAEAVEGNDPNQDMKYKDPPQDLGCVALAEAGKCVAPTVPVECEAPAEAVKCVAPTVPVECEAPAQVVKCNVPSENMDSITSAENMECIAPAENMECIAPAENMECIAPVENMECIAPTENIESSANAVQNDTKSIQEQS